MKICPCNLGMTIILALILILFFAQKKNHKTTNQPFKSESMKKTNINLFGVKYPFSLPDLAYPYNALEPHLDEETAKIHHTKHHQSYVDNVNKALQEVPELQKYTIEELLSNLSLLPVSVQERIRNNAGGHFSHMLYWNSMTPHGGGQPQDEVAQAIEKSFGSFDAFKELFVKMALGHVGSGWTWLCVDKNKKLVALTTLNHDTPLAQGLYPILVLDVWEHAYYLKFRNKRADFIAAWWNVVNWENVSKLYKQAEQSIS